MPLFENILKLLFHTLVYKWGQAFAWHYYVFQKKFVFPCFTVLLFCYSLCCSFALLLLSLLLICFVTPFFVAPFFITPLLCYSLFQCSLFHYALLCYTLALLLLALLHHSFATPLFHCALASLHPMAKMQIGADLNEIQHQWNQNFG